jgi:hypothetical protein
MCESKIVNDPNKGVSMSIINKTSQCVKKATGYVCGKIRTAIHYALFVYVLISICALAAGAYFAGVLLVSHQKAEMVEKKSKEDIEVGKWAVAAINLAAPKMSELQKQVLAQAIVKVTGDIFVNFNDRTTFITLISNESRFDKDAKSPAGAVGLTQVMPQYVNEFAALCGMGKVSPDDLTDVHTNLMLGACLFRELTEDLHGNVGLALGAYNAGKSSLSLKEMRGLRAITNTETLNYVVRYVYVKGEVENVVKTNPPKYEVKFSFPGSVVQGAQVTKADASALGALATMVTISTATTPAPTPTKAKTPKSTK